MSTPNHPPTHTNLLIDEAPLQVLPSLATRFGLHEAIILQQIHYWLNPNRKSGKPADGRSWIFNSYKQWHEQFPFLTEKVIGNAVRSLETQGILLSRQDLNPTGSDRRKWYTIDYQALYSADHPLREGQRPIWDDERPYRDHDDAQTGPSSIAEITAEREPDGSSVPTELVEGFTRVDRPVQAIPPVQPKPVAAQKPNPVWELVEAYCQAAGIPGVTNKGKATGQAKQLVAAGFTPDEVRAAFAWLAGEPWIAGAIDLGTILTHADKFRAARVRRAPAAVTDQPPKAVGYDPLDPDAYLAYQRELKAWRVAHPDLAGTQ